MSFQQAKARVVSRRSVMRQVAGWGAGLLGGVAAGSIEQAAVAEPAAADAGLIREIEKITLKKGRDGSGPTWFHPRACVVPRPQAARPSVLMTLQTITGSDYFGAVHFMESTDLGKTWTEPAPVAALGRVPAPGGWEEGVCDVVPEYHAATKTVLALGHNVFYKGDKFSANQPARWPVYCVWNNGTWGERQKLDWDDPRGGFIYTNNCGQRVTLPNGDIAFVMSFGPRSNGRMAAGVRCRFDGKKLAIEKVGTPLVHAVGRGLLEPSLTHWKGRFYVTLRAEDGHGYVATSDDGLEFREKRAWTFDDGSPLAMSTTQQHWLAHSERLFLIYTRKDASNVNVLRWRSPLFLSEVDTERLCLVKGSERVVLPLVGDGVKEPDAVALSGNFHPVSISRDEAWVTDGEMLPKRGFRGDLLLARIRWTRPNQLAGG